MKKRMQWFARQLAANLPCRQSMQRWLDRRPGSPAEPPFDFDALARDVAEGLSRREALARLGRGLAVVLLTAAAGDAAWGQGNRRCPPGEYPCSDGGCCPAGTTCCSGSCCPAGQPCVNGQCSGGQGCPTGQIRCSGTCVDPLTDPANCGACGVVCPPGFGCCGGSCTDLSTIQNCGLCGNVCPERPNATPVCVSGQCSYTCLAGFADCDPSAANGCETDLRTNVGHCGACGTACHSYANATTTCVDGVCGAVCYADFDNCDGNATTGCEANLLTNPEHCGVCGNVCSFPNAAAICNGGHCELGRCFFGYADCDGAASNGCETDLHRDGNNCGACGHVCRPGETCQAGHCLCGNTTESCGPNQVCSNGICCPEGQVNCNDTCVDLLNDPDHCGTCGHQCLGLCRGGECVSILPPGSFPGAS